MTKNEKRKQLRLLNAAKDADWLQVVYNGGPPCFHLEDGRFCLRAERWDGHKKMNKCNMTLDKIRNGELGVSQNKDLYRLYSEQNAICYYCGEYTEFYRWSVDHKIPRCRGGQGQANKVGACKTCNGAKGNLTEEEFRPLRKDSYNRKKLIAAIQKTLFDPQRPTKNRP